MDTKVLDEAVAMACDELAAVGILAMKNDMRAALLAGVKVLLGEPVAFRYRDSDVFGDECWRYLDLAPLGQYAETQRLYAPSLGEGDGR